MTPSMSTLCVHFAYYQRIQQFSNIIIYIRHILMQEEDPKDIDKEEIQPKSLTHESVYFTYIQRYYTTFESDLYYVHMHSNGLFLVRVKLSALTQNGAFEPKSIKWVIEDVEVKGKKKKGGVKVKPNTHIAHIELSQKESKEGQGSNKIFKVEACVQGVIIEQNDRLAIQNLGDTDGYFVIIMSHKKFIPEDHNMKQINYIGNS